MGLPKQVRDQIEEANKIAEELQKNAEPEAEEVVSEEDSAKDKETAESEDLSFDNEAEEVEQPKAEVTEHPSTADFEHKYKTLQGMYNSEKRRNSELQEYLNDLRTQVEELKEAQTSKPDQEIQEVAEKLSLLSPDEIEDYGSDLIDVMKRAAREAVQDEINELRAENAELKQAAGQITNRFVEDERSKLYNALDSQVENWRDINRDYEFLQWLNERDVYSGESRKTLLNKAFLANDAGRVINFFKGFLNETAAVTPSGAGHQAERKKKTSLESLASPGTGASSSADNTSNQGRMWKESDIARFYEDARKGKFKGRDDEYRRTERSIQAAMTSGRLLLGQ